MYFVIKRKFKKFDTRLFLFYSSVFFLLTFMVFFSLNLLHINLRTISNVNQVPTTVPADFGDGLQEVTISGGDKPKGVESNPNAPVSGGSSGDGGSGSSSDDDPETVTPDVIFGEQVQEFEIIIKEVNPPINTENFIDSNDLSFSELDGCGQVSCEVIQECSSQSNTEFSLISKEISSGFFKKSFCNYENPSCEGKFIYEKCELKREINLRVQPSFALATITESPENLNEEVVESSQETAIQESSRDADSSGETLIEVLDSQTAENLVSVFLNSKERKLSLSIGNSPEAPSYCYNGEKDSSEERIDCGFVCNKSCGEDDSSLVIFRLVSWWIFLALFGLLITQATRRK